jgi:hypothetical protein
MARRRPRRDGQKWRTFIKNHSHELFACDFMTQYTALFTTVYEALRFPIAAGATATTGRNCGTLPRFPFRSFGFRRLDLPQLRTA